MLLGLLAILIYSSLAHSNKIVASQKSIVITRTEKKSPWTVGIGFSSTVGIDQTDEVDSDGFTQEDLGVGLWFKYLVTNNYALELKATRLNKEFSVEQDDAVLVEEVQKFQIHLLGRYMLFSGLSLGAGGFSDFKASGVDRGQNLLAASELDTSASKSTYGALVSLTYEKSISFSYGLFANVNYIEPIQTEPGEDFTRYYFMVGLTVAPE